ncbi:MAG: acetyl-CoA carboxylase subunit beta [Candidatus Melainabacteria bacterium RIFCSPHIGHO2_02_FULL_34_12]|nr:MAG: acetyl-CoA carboxylase subunit beta [Candidatus Melainabacteria bacterium RIFCSPHIGHO2_02_FULL_34_12]
MGLKDFFKNRQLKKAAKLRNGTSTAGSVHELKTQPPVCDEVLCTLWAKCTGCNELLYTSELKKNLGLCKHCSYHHRVTANERIEQLTDFGNFIEINENIYPTDPLNFTDLKPYKDRLKEAEKSSGSKEAITTGIGTINNQGVALAVMEFQYIGGSMGSVVGEKITRLIEKAIEQRLPVIIVSSSGGARMHEGILSLMQMAKTSSALRKLHEEKLLYISLLTEPTFGGVTASFSMLGDIIISEPKARIGFAGRRVIEETIRQKLPKDFQTAEYLLENGQIDAIVSRSELKQYLSNQIKLHSQNKSKASEKNGTNKTTFEKLLAWV